MLGVLRIVIQPSGEPARACQHFRRASLFLFGEMRTEYCSATRSSRIPSRTPTPGTSMERRSSHFASVRDNDGGDADHFGAVFADAERAHAPGNVEASSRQV